MQVQTLEFTCVMLLGGTRKVGRSYIPAKSFTYEVPSQRFLKASFFLGGRLKSFVRSGALVCLVGHQIQCIITGSRALPF